ncbi:hypothetical protein V8C86DRAFT_2534733 [Haematococcus lacustris]
MARASRVQRCLLLCCCSASAWCRARLTAAATRQARITASAAWKLQPSWPECSSSSSSSWAQAAARRSASRAPRSCC